MGDALAALYRAEHGRVLSSVLARTRDFPLAEESVQDAFASAAEAWGDAPPAHARAWLIRVARNKVVDRLRRRARFAEVDADVLADVEGSPVVHADGDIEDDRLRLVFTCCHPALAPEAQVTLTLRTVAGLTTEEIARLLFAEPSAIAQRLVRTQRKIRDAHIPYAVPERDKRGERLAAVLAVVYLVFTEGYAATSGDLLVRAELCDEAIRLGRLIVELLPGEPSARALLALMLLHDARRDARFAAGEIVLLEEQDRGSWDRAKIEEGLAALDDALAAGANGPYSIEASIAGLHARARRAEDTDWRQIVGLYDMLLAEAKTAVVELNRAVAVAMASGAERGLAALDLLRFKLAGHHLYHAARADLLLRLGRPADAARAYRLALTHVHHPAEKRFLERRLTACNPRE